MDLEGTRRWQQRQTHPALAALRQLAYTRMFTSRTRSDPAHLFKPFVRAWSRSSVQIGDCLRSALQHSAISVPSRCHIGDDRRPDALTSRRPDKEVCEGHGAHAEGERSYDGGGVSCSLLASAAQAVRAGG